MAAFFGPRGSQASETMPNMNKEQGNQGEKRTSITPKDFRRTHSITMHLVMLRVVVDKWWWQPHGSGDCRELPTL